MVYIKFCGDWARIGGETLNGRLREHGRWRVTVSCLSWPESLPVYVSTRYPNTNHPYCQLEPERSETTSTSLRLGVESLHVPKCLIPHVFTNRPSIVLTVLHLVQSLFPNQYCPPESVVFRSIESLTWLSSYTALQFKSGTRYSTWS